MKVDYINTYRNELDQERCTLQYQRDYLMHELGRIADPNELTFLSEDQRKNLRTLFLSFIDTVHIAMKLAEAQDE